MPRYVEHGKNTAEEKRVVIISNLQVFYLKDVAEMNVDGMERYSCSASKRCFLQPCEKPMDS